jgi:ectoine hydroxylase-related dioxygenase (phytanoyl-CoA dioxygenase family)
MAFEFCDSMINQYWSQGYCVFRQILPGPLLNDLRQTADKARVLAHETDGPQSQRIQPLVRHESQLDLQPFRDYCELPELIEAVGKLMGPDYRHHNFDNMGLLVDPAGHSWNQGWHRDGPVEVAPEIQELPEVKACLAERWHDRRVFNQINCAIYNDSCTWYVPGSHLRQDDFEGEQQSVGHSHLPKRDAYASEAEFERACYLHCAEFPGAQQMHMIAGDFMIYRNHGWHCGNYLSYQPRATIHDTCIYTGEDKPQFKHDWQALKAELAESHRKDTERYINSLT